jgi:DNA-directed RNA polymerase specialized sigma24 family protein
MLRVGETELWWSFEEAAETLEVLSDTVADAFAQLRKEMEEKLDGR